MRWMLIFLFFLPAYASAVTKSARECACSAEVVDTHEEPAAFAFGKFSGQCIDSCRFRRPIVLTKSPRHLRVANLLHVGKFTSTAIPLDQITRVDAGFETFAPGVSHVFLRFHLKKSAPALKLYSQSGRRAVVGEIRSVAISAEGVPPKGAAYSLLESYSGNYLLVNRLVSGPEVDHWTKQLQHPVKYYPLKLSAKEARAALVAAVSEGHQTGLNNIYRLFSNNCSTSMFRFLDQARGSMSTNTPLRDALPIALPWNSLMSLQGRSLIDSQSIFF